MLLSGLLFVFFLCSTFSEEKNLSQGDLESALTNPQPISIQPAEVAASGLSLMQGPENTISVVKGKMCVFLVSEDTHLLELLASRELLVGFS
jgi:hypothetical protein